MAKFNVQEDGNPDMVKYIALYQGTPIQEIPKPFCYRVLTPYLARLVPFPEKNPISGYLDVNKEKIILFKFGVVNALGVAVAGYVLYLLALQFGFSLYESILTSLLYFVSFPTVNYTVTPLVDALAHAFIAVGLYCVLRQKTWILAMVFALGMFAKETTILVFLSIPLLYGIKRQTLILASTCVPGLIGYAVFRFLLFPTDYGYNYPFWETVIRIAHLFIPGSRMLWNLYEIIIAFGPLWIFMGMGFLKIKKVPQHPLLRLSGLTVVLITACLIIGENMGRILFLGFPFMIPLAFLGWKSALKYVLIDKEAVAT